MLDRRRLRRRHVERAGDRDGEALAAPAEHARELADAPVGDGERRAVVADVDDDLRAGRLAARRPPAAPTSARSIANASRSMPASLMPAFLQASDVAVDELAVGDDEQDAPDGLPVSSSTCSESTCQSSTASSSGIGSVSCARKRIAFASWRGSSMPVISKVRTPMRLLAMPSRTPFFGSLCFAKSSFSASARPSMSRSSPPTTTPSGERSRARPAGAAATPFVRDARGGDLRRADLQPDEPALALRGAFCFFGAFGSFSPLAPLTFCAFTAPSALLLLPTSLARASRTAAASPSARFGLRRGRLLARSRALLSPNESRASRTAAASPSRPSGSLAAFGSFFSLAAFAWPWLLRRLGCLRAALDRELLLPERRPLASGSGSGSTSARARARPRASARRPSAGRGQRIARNGTRAAAAGRRRDGAATVGISSGTSFGSKFAVSQP